MQLQFPVSTPWRHIGEEEVWLHSFLGSALDGGESKTSHSGRFTARKNPSTLQIGGWMGPRADLDVVKNKQISFLCWESKRLPSIP